MKKGISICFFAAVIIIFFLFLIYQNRGDDNTEIPQAVTEEQLSYDTTETELLTESMQLVQASKYYLTVSDGYLIVYDSKTDEIYCETNIKVEFLPAELQQKIADGITFQTDAELYDFLESYSS